MVKFQRAIFLSWYCSKGDCKFCYMSTQKSKIKNPRLARRTRASILAEALICKACGWDIEFLSGGYGSYTINELVELTKQIHQITNQKQWLNIGTLSKSELQKFNPYIKGVCGAVECINPKLHDELCPSKPVSEITKMFKTCNQLNLKKSMTIIVGLGETKTDIPSLIDFIKKHNISRITFYSLNPHPETIFKSSPNINYYATWIKETRKAFPKLEIIAGLWVDKVQQFSQLIKAGANHITKFPSIKLFSSKQAKEMENQVKLAKKTFQGTLTRLPRVNWDKEIDVLSFNNELKQQIKVKLYQYLKTMIK